MKYLPPKHLTGPNAAALLHPSSTIQKTLFARLESLSLREAVIFAQAFGPETLAVFAKVFPEIEWMMRRLIWRLGQPSVRAELANDPDLPPLKPLQ